MYLTYILVILEGRRRGKKSLNLNYDDTRQAGRLSIEMHISADKQT